MVTVRIQSIVWFAAGIAIALISAAVFVGARADAVHGDDDSTFVPIVTCRLFDTRPGTSNVGPKDTPLGAGDEEVMNQPVVGTNGNCVIPDDAVGVAMNVTALNGTAPSFLVVFPAESDTPLGSNMNWLPGQPPTPNKVDVKLFNGAIWLFNAFGTVDVIGDVVGYYTHASLVDLQDQVSALEAANIALKTDVNALKAINAGNRIDVLEDSRPFAVSDYTVLNTDGTLAEVTLTAPVDGQVTLNAHFFVTGGESAIVCSIGGIPVGPREGGALVTPGEDSGIWAGTGTVDIAAGTTRQYVLNCSWVTLTGDPVFHYAYVTAIFTPAP